MGNGSTLEDHRHRCEIRWFLCHSAARDGNGRDYLDAVAKQRGQAAADALEQASREQWRRGSRGIWGEWK